MILDSSGETLASSMISCDVPENCIVEVAELSWGIPDRPSDSYRVELALSKESELLASNEYTIKVLAS